MTTYFVGTSGWSYPAWRGLFYPQDLARSRWLDYYVTQLPVVEVNATFYRSFEPRTYATWREKAPEGFRYILKVPRWISHESLLQDVTAEIAAFWEDATRLEERLGLVLLQLPPSMPYDLERLRRALLAFGDPRRVAVEVRHSRWQRPELLELLAGLGSSFCNTDAPGSPLTPYLTGACGYLRLHGRREDARYTYDYSQEELEEIAAAAQALGEAGAETVYVLFNNTRAGDAPLNAVTLRKFLEHEG
ncbi:MAG: DUF72 domain-containing protein [Anaerolineales bacterium]